MFLALQMRKILKKKKRGPPGQEVSKLPEASSFFFGPVGIIFRASPTCGAARPRRGPTNLSMGPKKKNRPSRQGRILLLQAACFRSPPLGGRGRLRWLGRREEPRMRGEAATEFILSTGFYAGFMRTITCWRSRRTVVDGETRVLVCGLREGDNPLRTTRVVSNRSDCRRGRVADRYFGRAS